MAARRSGATDVSYVRSQLFKSLSATEILHGETGITHYLPEQASTEITFTVIRDSYSTAIRMPKNRVATALPDAHEPLSLEGSNNLMCCDYRKVRAHTATFTRETATSS